VSEPHLPRWSIQPLSPQHQRAGFDCGVSGLNDLLAKYAGQNQRSGLCRAYVAVTPGSGRVEGFYTLSSSCVRFGDLPEADRKRLPRYPLPTALVGKPAVHLSSQGKCLGRLLLLDAMARASRAADAIGLHAIEARAKDAPARAFYVKFGFTRLLDDDLHLYLRLAVVCRLGLPT